MAQDTQSKPKAHKARTEKVVPARQKTAVKQTIYVGPNLAGDLHIGRFTVDRDAWPGPLQDAIKADPVLGRLFVPVAQLAHARAELGKATSVFTQAAQHAYKKYRLGGTK
jgi:hypothetical protein